MAFNKADRLKAAEILKANSDTKHGQPKRKPGRPRKRRKPGPKPKDKLAAPMKQGVFTDNERIAVETLVKTFTEDTPPEVQNEQIKAMAVALRRTPESLRNNVISARERILADQETYAGLNMVAAKIAAYQGDARPAQWALERGMTTDEKGKKIRVVESLKGEDNGPRLPVVNIGVMLGGIAPGANLKGLPTVTVSSVDDEDLEP